MSDLNDEEDAARARAFVERFRTNPDRAKREQRYAKLAKQLRDAWEGLGPEGFAAYLEDSKFSRQDIVGLCERLQHDTGLMTGVNGEIAQWRRALTPERIWTGKLP